MFYVYQQTESSLFSSIPGTRNPRQITLPGIVDLGLLFLSGNN